MSMKIEKATGNEVATPEAAKATYVDPRVGYKPLTPHQRKAVSKRRAQRKAAKLAKRRQH